LEVVVVIDFRYHLVSVIAIFLALALGIVVGTAALNGGIVDNLKSRNDEIIQDKRDLEGTVRDLRTQVSRRDELTGAVAARAVAGRLKGQRVLFVATPGSSTDTLDKLTALVTSAGGASAGVLRLRDDLLDPAKSQVVDDVVASVAPAGVRLPEGTPTDKAVVELAAALVTTRGGTPLSADAAAKVIGGFTSADLVDVQRPSGGAGDQQAATLAVLVAPPGSGEPLDDLGQQRQRALLTLVRTFDTRSEGLVVAGPVLAAEEGGLLDGLRGDDGLSDNVSSVDAADTPYGQLVVILALDEQAAGGSGRYGQGPGAQAGAPAADGR